MSNKEILHEKTISKRKLPANLDREDLSLFEQEIEKSIPATFLLNFDDVTIKPKGTLFSGNKVLAESFYNPNTANSWKEGKRSKLKNIVNDLLNISDKKTYKEAVWITDNHSSNYFHWMTDALPRLLEIKDKTGDATLLLPKAYSAYEYVASSLKPFQIKNVQYVSATSRCDHLKIPTLTAPTGNYNEKLITELRELYTEYYKQKFKVHPSKRIYISRGKAPMRKIANEDECLAILKEYEFEIHHFEDYDFEQQAKVALDAKYLISNHGAGLTNILFMNSGSNVLELRHNEDDHNNCYFALASALSLNYFYQLCSPKNLGENAHTADLIVDPKSLRKNVEEMIKD